MWNMCRGKALADAFCAHCEWYLVDVVISILMQLWSSTILLNVSSIISVTSSVSRSVLRWVTCLCLLLLVSFAFALVGLRVCLRAALFKTVDKFSWNFLWKTGNASWPFCQGMPEMPGNLTAVKEMLGKPCCEKLFIANFTFGALSGLLWALCHPSSGLCC